MMATMTRMRLNAMVRAKSSLVDALLFVLVV